MSLLSDLNDKIKRLSTRVAAEFKAQQAAIDSKVSTVNGIAPDENGNVEIAAGNAALPLGWEYTRLVSDKEPKGGVDYLGQEATREFYADLWEWVNIEHPGRIISEDDWQAMYAAQNGNVPYYSTGDGSTTFRFPRTVSYLRAGDVAGQYTAEGLPNITGLFNFVGHNPAYHAYTGAFGTATISSMPVTGIAAGGSWVEGWGNVSQPFDASLSSSVYGSSDHVTPETITVVMGIIAFGEVRSIGTATEEGIVADLGYLEDSVDAIRQDYVKKSGDTMTGDLVLQRESPQMRIIDPTVTKGTALDAGVTKYLELLFADSTELTHNPSLTGTSRVSDANIGIVGSSVSATGLVQTYLRAYKNEANSTAAHTIGVEYDTANNTGYVFTTATKFRFGNGTQFWIA